MTKIRKPGRERAKVEVQRDLAKAWSTLGESPPRPGEGFPVPEPVRLTAQLGLLARARKVAQGSSRPGGTAVGQARGVQLSYAPEVGMGALRRMRAYFARHEIDKDSPEWGTPGDPSPGHVAWLLWGGDAGRDWAELVTSSGTSNPKSDETPEEYWARLEERTARYNTLKALAIAHLKENGLVIVVEHGRETIMLLHPSTTIPNGWQVSYFDRQGPYGHVEDATQDGALRQAFDMRWVDEVIPLTEQEFMDISSTEGFREGVKRVTYTGLLNTMGYEFGWTDAVVAIRQMAMDQESLDDSIVILREGLTQLREARGHKNPYPPPEPERIMISNPKARSRKYKAEPPLGKYEDMRVRLVVLRDPAWKGPSKPIGRSEDVYEAVRTMGVEPVEAMYVVLLDTKHQIIGLYEAGRGGGRSLAVEPAALLQPVIATGAQAMILVHNHPSGNPEPSMEDRLLTDRIASACETLGVKLLDHLVIGENTYVSLADRGWM